MGKDFLSYSRTLKGVRGIRAGHSGIANADIGKRYADYVPEDIEALRARYVPTCEKCGRHTENWGTCAGCESA